MVINNEINQFSSAGDTHIETKLHSTDSFSLKHEYETIKKHMNEELKNEKSWLVLNTHIFFAVVDISLLTKLVKTLNSDCNMFKISCYFNINLIQDTTYIFVLK